MNRFKLNTYKLALLQSIGIIVGTTMLSPSLANAAEELVLDEVKVIDSRISDTQPVKGYKADHSSSSTRTDTPLKDVPQAITVITKDVVNDLSIQSLTQAVEYVPGVQGAQGEGNRDAIIFRGNQTTSDLFVDGMRDDVQIFRDLYNTENLEVIKGPNAVASGRGGAGGIINRVTKQAGWDPIREFRASLGAWDHKRAQIDIGQGINDVAAFRLNAVYEDSESYRDGVELERYGFAPTVTFKLSEQTKIRLNYEYFKDKRIGDRGFPSVQGGDGDNLDNRPYDLGDTDQFFGNAKFSPNESEVNAFSAFIEHDFGNGLTIKNSTRYADYDKFYQNFYAGSSVNVNTGDLTIKSYRDETDRENFTNQTDLIYTLDAGSMEHKLLASFEITEQDNKNRRIKPSPSSFTVNVTNPIVPASDINAITNIDRDQKVDVSVFAVTLQDQIKFNDKWSAVVGFRYDNIDIDYDDIKNGESINIDDDLFSPRVGLIYSPAENLSLYANYSITRVPRTGDQLVSLRGNIDQGTFDPEKFVNKEIGAKLDITPRLALNMAAYILDRENVVAADPDDAANTILVDGQETKGLEISLAGQVTSKWDILAAATFQKGQLTKDIDATTLDGAQLANTPDRTFSLWNKYQINDIWSVALGVVSVSQRLSALEKTTATSIMPGYTRYDAAVYADFTDNLRLQINIENLTDKEYALFGHNTNNITPGAPLNGRATLIYNF